MHVIEKISDIENILLYEATVLHWGKKGLYNIYGTKIINYENIPIIYATTFRNAVYFQVENVNNLNILRKNTIVRKFPKASWALISAIEVNAYIYIYSRDFKEKPGYYFINDTDIIETSISHCNFFFNENLFERCGDELTCFPLNDINVLWQISTQQFFEDTRIIKHLFGFNDYIILALENGSLIALNLSDGSLAWKCKEKTGPHYDLFNEKLYTIGGDYDTYVFWEIDANTGKIVKEIEVDLLFKRHEFYPSCDIIVYEDYIFLKSVRDGILIFRNNENMDFKEQLKFDCHIPTGKDNLIWHDKKLYVLDANKMLHIFEE